MNETIYALATAPGRAAVAVIRVSGPEAGPVLDALAGTRPPPRRAVLRRLRGREGEPLDDALVLWFKGPASFTGEDSAELHVHGGPAVISGVIHALEALIVRHAEPGEFTRRAFENGKLDLTQAEAVADMVDAQTAAQQKQAIAQLEGALGDRYREWRGRLIEALALLEAEVDFPDEDLPEGVGARSRPGLAALRAELRAALTGAARGERVREGYRIALIGAPNAGKSTLLNRLAQRDAAIVTSTPGTTRDVIEVPLLLNGYAALLADTAGLRDAEDEAEAEGVRRARAWASSAELRVVVVDCSGPAPIDIGALGARAGDLMVLSKSDLVRHPSASAVSEWAADENIEQVATAAHDDRSIEAVRTWLAKRVTGDLAGNELPAVNRARHRRLLEEADAHLARALETREPELAAEDVRMATRALGQVVGAVASEDVLGQVFATFCIGK